MVTTLTPDQQGIAIAKDSWRGLKGNIRQSYGHIRIENGPDTGKTIAEVIADSEPEWQEPNRAYFYQPRNLLFGTAVDGIKWERTLPLNATAHALVRTLLKGFLLHPPQEDVEVEVPEVSLPVRNRKIKKPVGGPRYFCEEHDVSYNKVNSYRTHMKRKHGGS
jgi:hypothetical protein